MNNEEVLKKIKDIVTLSYDDHSIYYLQANGMMMYKGTIYILKYNVNILIKLILLSKKYPLLINDIENILVYKLVDINWQNKDGSTALMFAIQFSHKILSIDIINILLKYGADPNIKNEMIEINNALMYAVRYNTNTIIMQMLLANGTDINAQNDNGNTALIVFINTAFHSNRIRLSIGMFLEMVNFLMDNGIDINIKNNNRLTALLIFMDLINSVHIGNDLYLQIIKLLLKRGIYTNNIDRTTLRYAFNIPVSDKSILVKITKLCLKYDAHNVHIGDANILLMIESDEKLTKLINKYYNIHYKHRTLQSKCLIVAKLSQNINLRDVPPAIIDHLIDYTHIDWTMKFDLYRASQIFLLKLSIKTQKRLLNVSKTELLNGSYSSMLK